MGKLITNERLSHAGHHAAGSVLRDHQNMLKLSGTKTTLQCKYIGTVNEDEQLRTTTQVKFHWIVGEDTSAPLEQTTFPCKILHCIPKPKNPDSSKHAECVNFFQKPSRNDALYPRCRRSPMEHRFVVVP